MTDRLVLVLGTHNRKKGNELAEMLAPYGFTLRTLADYDDPLEVVEDGDSFAANAALKATQQAVHLKQWVLGEDSGLAVDALDGRPGIFSARFSGPTATDHSNNQFLLAELADTPLEKRTAHYVCHTALSDPQGRLRVNCQGYCQGRIRFQPAGTAGFGYDPLFIPEGYENTFGELGPEVKAKISHRSRAFRKMSAFLDSILV